MPPRDDGGLGTQLVGDKIAVNHRNVQVTKLLGEGGFSYVYLVKDMSSDSKNSDNSASQSNPSDPNNKQNGNKAEKSPVMVLKVTSIHSRAQRDIAEKEAKLLSRLSHPSIIKMHDACYRTAPQNVGVVGSIIGTNSKNDSAAGQTKDGRPQHMILMEYCEGGHALDVCNKLAGAGQRFDLSALIIAFGQICNAVSYLHAQRPPIVHRDLKPVNFLVKNGAYKLCDFGSAVFGHVELKTQRARQEADEVIQKTTTQMFRSPEMVDLYMSNKLTQSTDVWALGCCLYSLAYLQNCFEEGSNLAILSVNYKIPEENPYGEGLVELIDRMLTVDNKARADMTEVILCLSAIYSGRPLPPRKKAPKTKKKDDEAGEMDVDESGERVGAFRTDGQGIQEKKKKKKKEAPTAGKKLASDSAAARRLRGRTSGDPSASPSPGASGSDTMFEASFSAFASGNAPTVNEELAFSTEQNHFAEAQEGSGAFASFDAGKEEGGKNGFGAFDGGGSGGGGGKAGWTGTQHAEVRKSGTQTADGFAGSFSAKGAQEAAAAEAAVNGAVAAQMEEMDISEEEARRPRRRRS
mmetsp:Transcript_16830/g.27947  ORF Transcript_16830/g.27947 Transcript_16830/m.27947 type:complete len:577 (-) Transcript_16830:92-1822(-)|eukprot:CAMPEP_0119029830 /NCGR_PEP_ID=MMETSP1176-20130426/40718_1 /TAXON_ID=265551 /ORGANISM="Synedropsis recta cf, Strain CCMP1620" /LENGTH=576 /DNA_ID=CAMNT_0006986185 /DNA_START=531 /DNA_END=2261 /DNA_ORIENTATION=-